MPHEKIPDGGDRRPANTAAAWPVTTLVAPLPVPDSDAQSPFLVEAPAGDNLKKAIACPPGPDPARRPRDSDERT